MKYRAIMFGLLGIVVMVTAYRMASNVLASLASPSSSSGGGSSGGGSLASSPATVPSSSSSTSSAIDDALAYAKEKSDELDSWILSKF